MLLPEFQSIAEDLTKRYEAFLKEDVEEGEGLEVAELLTAEEQVKAFVQGIGQSMLQTFVDVRVLQAKASRRPCTCGRIPPLHRNTEWTRQTPFGPISVPDPYIYCPECHDSDRPLHALLGTDRETWSLIVEEAAVDLASDESCGKAVAKLERHHPGVEMDRTAALRMLHEHGNKARVFINDKLAEARAVAELPPARLPEGTDELEVQFDGGVIPVATLEPIEVPDGEEPELTPVRSLPKRRRVCRWEEAKVGLVQQPGEVDRLYSVQPTSGLEQSFDDLFALACIKGWDELTQVRGLSDGARHIRPRMEEVFDIGNFRFILDRPHCKEHLSSAGEALEPITDVPARQWADEALEKLELRMLEANGWWGVWNVLGSRRQRLDSRGVAPSEVRPETGETVALMDGAQREDCRDTFVVPALPAALGSEPDDRLAGSLGRAASDRQASFAQRDVPHPILVVVDESQVVEQG